VTEEQVVLRLSEYEADQGRGPDGTHAICYGPDQPFVTLAWNHHGSPIKSEGKPVIMFPTEESAWALWLVAFETYNQTRKGKIYWRARPQIFNQHHAWATPGDTWDGKDEITTHTGYAVWSRVFVDTHVEGTDQ
jgi:hypothetical protein